MAKAWEGHTKAPWEADPDGNEVFGPCGSSIAMVLNAREAGRANAELIAAAPKLDAILSALLDRHDPEDPTTNYGRFLERPFAALPRWAGRD